MSLLQLTKDPTQEISLNLFPIEVYANEKGAKEKLDYLAACLLGNTAQIEERIRKYPRSSGYSLINIADANGTTALMYAAGSRNLQAAQLIATQSPLKSWQAVNCFGRNALFYACDANDEDMVKYLYNGLHLSIAADRQGVYASFYAFHNVAIQALLREPTQRQMSIESTVAAQTFKKYSSEGSAKAHEMVENKLKRKIERVSSDAVVRPDGKFERVKEKEFLEDLMSTEITRKEVLLYVKTHLHQSNERIAAWVRSTYAFEVKLKTVQKYRELAQRQTELDPD